MTAYEQRILAAIRAKIWRSEISLCREFSGHTTDPKTEDALFSLVQQGKIEWFGNNDYPLRYRAIKSH